MFYHTRGVNEDVHSLILCLYVCEGVCVCVYVCFLIMSL